MTREKKRQSPGRPRRLWQVGRLWGAGSLLGGLVLVLGGLNMAGVSFSACTAPEQAAAYKITDRKQLIGGPEALGDVGDFMLENGKIRIIIQDIGFSRGSSVFGGALIDADLVRPQTSQGVTGGQGSFISNGHDLMGEMFPAFFLEAVDPKSVEVLADGKDGKAARVLVSGRGNEFLAMTEYLLKTILDPETLRFETEYILEPGVNYIKIVSRVINDDPRGRVHGFNNVEFGGTKVPVPMGDALLFSNKTPTFFPGDGGFDQRLSLEARYTVPIQLPALPGLVAEFIAAKGDQVSYGLLPVPDEAHNYTYVNRDLYSDYPGTTSNHSLVTPFTASGLIPAYFAYPPDQLGPDEVFSFARYFIVGSGDVGSINDTVQGILGNPVGTITGRVFEQPSLRPMNGASVLILDDKGQPVNQVETDAEGWYRTRMKPGTYSALVLHERRALKTPYPISVTAGKTTSADLMVDAAAEIVVAVSDDQGRRIPARVTVVGVSPERELGVPAYKSLYHAALGEKFCFTDMVPDTQDPLTRQYVEAILIGHDGVVSGQVRPGKYTVYVSRGPEYSVSSVDIDIAAGQTLPLAAQLSRVVDTNGYISADMHMHGQNSVDADAYFRPRVVDAVAEGLEVIVATDHNTVTDYSPAIAAQNLQPWLHSVVGIELTTLEMGHFNGFPLLYQPGPITHGSFAWAGRKAGDIFHDLRALGTTDTIVQVNHARDTIVGYFYQFRFDNETLALPGQTGLLAPSPDSHPEFMGENFSFDFDAIEVVNGKHLELIHNYRVPEVLPAPPLPREVPEAGELLRDANGQIAFFGVADDWMSLLEAGLVSTGTANSDSHHNNKGEIGYPRNFVAVPDDDPAKVKTADLMAGVRAHKVLMSYCPFVRVAVGDKGMGETVVPGDDGMVTLDVDIQTSSWCTPDTLNIYSGRHVVMQLPIPAANARHYRTQVKVPVSGDSFVLAEVTGHESTFPILMGNEVPSIELNAAMASLGDSLGLALDDFGNLRPHRRHAMQPYALTNPIFVDGDGDGSWSPLLQGELPLKSAGRPKNLPSTKSVRPKTLLPRWSKVDHPFFELPSQPRKNDLRALMTYLRSGH